MNYAVCFRVNLLNQGGYRSFDETCYEYRGQGAVVCETPDEIFCSSGAECVNTQTDPQHCGRCDNVCPADQSCEGGVCAASSVPESSVSFTVTCDMYTDPGYYYNEPGGPSPVEDTFSFAIDFGFHRGPTASTGNIEAEGGDWFSLDFHITPDGLTASCGDPNEGCLRFALWARYYPSGNAYNGPGSYPMKIWDAEPGFQARFEARFPEWGKRPFNDNSTYADEEFYPQWDVPHATSNQAKSDWEEYGVDTSQVIATLNVKRDDDVWLEGTFSHSGPRRWAVLDEPWLNYGWCDTEVTFSVSKAQVAPLY